MEFTIDAMANKMILIIVCLSALVVAGGAVFFYVSTAFYTNEAVPFGVGVLAAMGLNITKVIWLKSTINTTVDMNTPKAARYFYQFQYFLRLLLTAAVLLAAALLPDNVINLIGVVAGILTFPVTMRLMQFFIPPDMAIPLETPRSSNPIQDAITEMEKLSNAPEKEAE